MLKTVRFQTRTITQDVVIAEKNINAISFKNVGKRVCYINNELLEVGASMSFNCNHGEIDITKYEVKFNKEVLAVPLAASAVQDELLNQDNVCFVRIKLYV